MSFPLLKGFDWKFEFVQFKRNYYARIFKFVVLWGAFIVYTVFIAWSNGNLAIIMTMFMLMGQLYCHVLGSYNYSCNLIHKLNT